MSTQDVLKNKELPVFYVKDEKSAYSDHQDGTLLGFWIYLMSDCLIFAVFFVTYAVLGNSYAAGIAPIDVFDIGSILISTFVLLFSSLTYSFAMLSSKKLWKNITIMWLLTTSFLGIIFVLMEFREFSHLFHIGANPQHSAFLSSFFALVGLHGIHVLFGILWIFVLVVQILKYGLISDNNRRLICLSMFWHFLDLIWICVFSFVYLFGVV
ncbi:cytochrome o ubiquinol oxidase subunit III [Candidatus Liberibacter americanus]|uniref:Cytochrome bo(3) ubiquinol oxidase subunit 3 n=1 Tax=Candidatus Liberibacter americanus str. Sao Paulo TaxID=1261131 RepID=U6B6V9_9HYPH|nr:cytochrome o ubiquinol oxidase subunit III [Candidatus Liberibacter americanus]AHA27482.1 Heme/copper-type cytochrome/quinol oxidase, subunit 3 [Candidatus Liberibacter americanus str. Sao Paulo]EMS36556.1 cytochrome o ubiquinol oxidase subunit III [Candidatus Liberibacter americanus PW_SP]